jgi:hypothetical protein
MAYLPKSKKRLLKFRLKGQLGQVSCINYSRHQGLPGLGCLSQAAGSLGRAHWPRGLETETRMPPRHTGTAQHPSCPRLRAARAQPSTSAVPEPTPPHCVRRPAGHLSAPLRHECPLSTPRSAGVPRPPPHASRA